MRMPKKFIVDLGMIIAITIALILYLSGQTFFAIIFLILGFLIGWFRRSIYKWLS